MPLFGKSADTTGSSWEPEAAAGRLAHTVGADAAGVFTSDLSVSEYVLLGEAGFEPLGFVIGSSIYHIGLQVGKWSQNQELQVLTQAMYNARELAMSPDAGRGRASRRGRHRRRATANAGLRVGPGRPRVHRHRHRGQGDGRFRRCPPGA